MCIKFRGNMKILSICVPTYNRPDKLKELYHTFLHFALNEYGDQIEVVVRDNSDDENSHINQSVLGSEVRYYKNDTNVGFCGNQIRLVRDANGQFIWIISDDDLILWSGFKHLMDILATANDDGIDCLMLPINYRNMLGDNAISDGYKKIDSDVRTYVTTLPTVPFGYFAASVIRLNKKRLDWVEKKFHENNILNIPLFLSMLKPESKMRFLDVPIIEYREDNHWMNIFKFYTDLHEVILFLDEEYHVNKELLLDLAYKESLLMIIIHRVGLRSFLDADAARWPLLAKLDKNLNFKTFLLAIAVIFPKVIIRPIYLFYLSLDHARSHGKISTEQFFYKYKQLHNFISKNNNC